MRAFGLIPLLALVVLGSPACRSKAEPPPTPEAVTVEEARALGESIEQKLAVCDPGGIDDALDLEHMVKLASADTPLTAGERSSLIAGVRGSMSLGRQLCDDVGIGSSYEMLRARQQGQEVSILFRALGEAGVNYLEFYLGKGSGDTPRIYDVYVYLSGERMSETMRDLLAATTSSRKTQQQARSFSRHVNDAREHLMAGESEQARAALHRLPEQMRFRRPVRLLEVMAAAGLGDEAYEKAIAAYEKAYPGDPSLDLVSIDGHLIRKQYDDAIAAVDRLAARLGGDPYLEMLKATFLVEKGELDAAWTVASAGLAAAPEFEDAHWMALTIALERKAYDDVASMMATLSDRFAAEFDPELMAEEDLWIGFLESPQGVAWSQGAAAP
jgi:tetratricopeptide (TPR) repeat protein